MEIVTCLYMPKEEPGKLYTRTKVVGLEVIMNMIYFHKLKKNEGEAKQPSNLSTWDLLLKTETFKN